MQIPSAKTVIIGRKEKALLRLRLFTHLLKLLKERTGSFREALRFLKILRLKYKIVQGEELLSKASKVGGKYYWRLATPGFPSPAINLMHRNEINRIIPNGDGFGLRTLLFAITKQCVMNCEHCFEWNNLNKPEKLTLDDIRSILHKFNEYGTTQVMFSGGEPMHRYDDIIALLKEKSQTVDYWIITSGFGWTDDRAVELKSAGLTGIMVSLDHHLPEENDRFRGYPGAWNIAVNAIISANRAGLVTALSLCPVKDFVTVENMHAYMDLAKSLNVSFVQILEPRQTGRYEGRDVLLNKQQTEVLETVFTEYNNASRYSKYPVVNYLGYHQRRTGCFGGGNRFFYIDTDGDAHLCPYCSGKQISALTHSAEEVIEALNLKKCHTYKKNQLDLKLSD